MNSSLPGSRRFGSSFFRRSGNEPPGCAWSASWIALVGLEAIHAVPFPVVMCYRKGMFKVKAPKDMESARRDLLLVWLAAGAASIIAYGVIFWSLGAIGPALVEAVYSVFTLISIYLVAKRKGPMLVHLRIQMTMVFTVSSSISAMMGGIVPSGGFILWSIICPVAAIVFLGFWHSLIISVTFFGLLCVAAIAPYPWETIWPLPENMIPWFIVANTAGGFSLAFVALWYFIAMLESETKQREVAQRLALRAQKLESVGTLAGGIAHDFNNILMALFGNLTLAKRQTSPGEAIHQHLTSAESALEQAAGLTTQLLTFSRGGVALKKNISLNQVIANSASFVLHGTTTKATIEIDPLLWKVRADSGQIGQLIGNLVLNAHQAMPAKGTVHVQAQNLDKDSPVPGLIAGRPYVHISVTDQGCGIPDEIKDRVFEPFFTTRPTGTGLGLASCFAIVRDHDGLITVDSQVGQGSRFDIYLPSTGVSAQPFEKKPSPCFQGQGHILIMDDEIPVREVLTAMVEELGYQVTACADGSQAIAAFQSRTSQGLTTDVIVLDLTVRGGMGGVEAARLIRAIDRDVPIVASSGYVDDRILMEYEKHCFTDVLIKPYTLERLCAVLSLATMPSSGSSPNLLTQTEESSGG